METAIFCLVDTDGHVYVQDGARSYADVAAGLGMDETECQKYRFDLTARQFLVDRAVPFGAIAAHEYLDERVGTPEKLMQFAEEGHLSKDVLVHLLDPESRPAFLDACLVLEKRYTEECAARNDPCLESGCSIDQSTGEICLQPLMRAGREYQKACAAEWVKIFRNPGNRIAPWKSEFHHG